MLKFKCAITLVVALLSGTTSAQVALQRSVVDASSGYSPQANSSITVVHATGQSSPIQSRQSGRILLMQGFIQPLSKLSRLSKPELTLFPNPSEGMVHIDMTIRKAPLTARVYSLSGSLSRTIDLPSGVSSFDLSDLPKGIYQIKFQYMGALLTSKKVILQ